MELSERIAYYRRTRGLSQEQLGDLVGVTRQAVSKWESGQSMPDAQSLAALCRALEVSADALLLGQEESPADDAEAPASAPALPFRCPCCGKEYYLTAAPACPQCGYDPHPVTPDGEERYAILLARAAYEYQQESLLRDLSLFTGRTEEELLPVLRDAYNDKFSGAGRNYVLLRGLSRSRASHIAKKLSSLLTLRIVSDDGSMDDDGLRALPNAFDTPKAPEKKLSLGFWGIVGAVVVGILIASFL